MGRSSILTLSCTLMASLAIGGAGLRAASSASVATDGRVTILAPSAALTAGGMVTGMVTVPLSRELGANVGAIALPPQTFGRGTQVRIQTESLGREIGQVFSRAGLQEASFTIIGDSDQIISVAVPPSISLTRLNGDGEVGFSPVTSLTGDQTGMSRLVAAGDGTGALAFDVGGRLQPTQTAAAGDYAGVLQVTVQYN